MYLDQGPGHRQEGEFAVLEKRRLKFTDNTCVTFWYHMYGVDVGYLDVYVDDMSYFSKEGDQGDQWYKATFKSDYAGTLTVRTPLHLLNYFLHKERIRLFCRQLQVSAIQKKIPSPKSVILFDLIFK